MLFGKKKNKEFYRHLEAMNLFVFRIGGFMNATETMTFVFDGEEVKCRVENDFDDEDAEFFVRPLTKKDFIDVLNTAGVGEWNREYCDSNILDGTQWQVQIEYSDGTEPYEINGSNAFPKDFQTFREILTLISGRMI